MHLEAEEGSIDDLLCILRREWNKKGRDKKRVLSMLVASILDRDMREHECLLSGWPNDKQREQGDRPIMDDKEENTEPIAGLDKQIRERSKQYFTLEDDYRSLTLSHSLSLPLPSSLTRLPCPCEKTKNVAILSESDGSPP